MPNEGRRLLEVEDRLDKRMPLGVRFLPNSVAFFRVSANDRSYGAQIEVEFAHSRYLESVALLRNFTLDPGAAKVLTSWDAAATGDGKRLTYSDTDPLLAGKTAYYWLRLFPVSRKAVRKGRIADFLVGPQTLDPQDIDLVPPDTVLSFDASKGTGVGGIVQIACSFDEPQQQRFDKVRIYIANYLGVAAKTLVADSRSSPFTFNLRQTEEAVTLYCRGVSKAGTEHDPGADRSKNLTLFLLNTVPCRVTGVKATEITGGVQLDFDAGVETTIASYKIFRAALDAGFGAAAQVGTVVPTGSGRYTFLDGSGNSSFEYYVVPSNDRGDGSESLRASTIRVVTSANLPPNVASNTTNKATVDSIDAGASATIRVYGAASGVGTPWERVLGFGSVQYPAGQVTGKAYATTYYVFWNGKQYVALISYPSAMPDNYVFAGKVTTVNAGGAGGVTGGGGITGGSGGRWSLTSA